MLWNKNKNEWMNVYEKVFDIHTGWDDGRYLEKVFLDTRLWALQFIWEVLQYYIESESRLYFSSGVHSPALGAKHSLNFAVRGRVLLRLDERPTYREDHIVGHPMICGGHNISALFCAAAPTYICNLLHGLQVIVTTLWIFIIFNEKPTWLALKVEVKRAFDICYFFINGVYPRYGP